MCEILCLAWLAYALLYFVLAGGVEACRVTSKNRKEQRLAKPVNEDEVSKPLKPKDSEKNENLVRLSEYMKKSQGSGKDIINSSGQIDTETQPSPSSQF